VVRYQAPQTRQVLYGFAESYLSNGVFLMTAISKFPQALVFDVFGTVVDWRSSIIEEGAAWCKGKPVAIDWARFADEWRRRYRPSLDRVRRGEIPWTKLDSLHRASLEELIKDFGITGITEEEKDHWNRVWHRLRPWPDAVAGLMRLKRKFTIAPLSNGNFSMLTGLGKNAALPWDAILSADLAKHYKPDREAYLMAAELLDLATSKIMLVAAHLYDLNAAHELGFQTGFVHRPFENGRGGKADRAGAGQFDVVAEDFLDLAAQLGA
jgi:2-haloacid dehalogenase